jgi:hypothetical protein
MKADLLRKEFAPDAVPAADGQLLLDCGDTLALIGRATEEGVPIVAVRGVADARAGRPGTAADAADYAAAVAEGHGCWEDAERFVRARRNGGLVFEVTLGDDPIEAV